MICPETQKNCRAFQCLRIKGCRHQVVSQPEPTNQAPAAPSLEQSADSEFVLLQGDCWVAGASGPRQDALREILHYATVYGQDGPVKVYEVKRTLIPHE